MEHMLTSWKEIAAYFRKSVRTVQRWEREHELPVRRPNADGRNLILASEGQLKEWMNRRGGVLIESELIQLKQKVRELEGEIQELRTELEAAPKSARVSSRGRLDLLAGRKNRVAS